MGVAGGFAQACHGKAQPLKRMQEGDGILYYSSKRYFGKEDKCQAFTAIGKVKDEEVYAFQMSENFCPFRRNIIFCRLRRNAHSRPYRAIGLYP